MKKTILTLFLIISTNASASSFTGRVVGVSDGDTVTLLTPDHIQYKIRLAGIDAPEKTQAFGRKSKEALSDCSYGRNATIQGEKVDRYGRLIGKVIVNGTDCNLRQIQLGLAWHYKKYQKEQVFADRESYNKSEIQARSEKLAIWSENDPIPPWEFRKLKKKKPNSQEGSKSYSFN